MRPRAQGRGGLGSRKQESKEQTISKEAYAFGEAEDWSRAEFQGNFRGSEQFRRSGCPWGKEELSRAGGQDRADLELDRGQQSRGAMDYKREIE